MFSHQKKARTSEFTKQDYLEAAIDGLQEWVTDGNWSISNTPPKPHQVKPLQQYLETRANNKHAVLPLSTGSGKTYLFATICEMLQDRALVLVPRDNLPKTRKAPSFMAVMDSVGAKGAHAF